MLRDWGVRGFFPQDRVRTIKVTGLKKYLVPIPHSVSQGQASRRQAHVLRKWGEGSWAPIHRTQAEALLHMPQHPQIRIAPPHFASWAPHTA